LSYVFYCCKNVVVIFLKSLCLLYQLLLHIVLLFDIAAVVVSFDYDLPFTSLSHSLPLACSSSNKL